MWRKRIRDSAKIATRTRTQRASCVVLGFCLINAVWSIIGNWSISFGGESYSYFNSGSRQSGIFSCGGYLVLAQRSSFFIASGLRPPDWQTRGDIKGGHKGGT